MATPAISISASYIFHIILAAFSQGVEERIIEEMKVVPVGEVVLHAKYPVGLRLLPLGTRNCVKNGVIPDYGPLNTQLETALSHSDCTT